MNAIETLVQEFTSRLAALLQSRTLERARLAVASALSGPRRGRSPKVSAVVLGRKPRKKAPRQLCPVPRCKNPAAPVFGMVCAEHKGVPKAKIKKYREARRVAKLGAKKSKRASAKAKKKLPAPARKRGKLTKKTSAKRPVARRKNANKSRPKTASKASQRAAAPPAEAASAA